MELLEPLYRRDEQTATTFGFRLPAFHRQRTLKPTIYGHAASTPFAFGPFRWTLELHLNGNGAWEGRSVSAFLSCVSKLCQGMCVRVPISMTVLRTDGGDPGLHVVKGSESPRDVLEFSGASRRVGWPDLVPLHDIASFLDSAEGLIVHVAMAKPARCCFEQPLSRDVIGGIDVFYSPQFVLAGQLWYLRVNPCYEDDVDVFASVHVIMGGNTSETSEYTTAYEDCCPVSSGPAPANLSSQCLPPCVSRDYEMLGIAMRSVTQSSQLDGQVSGSGSITSSAGSIATVILEEGWQITLAGVTRTFVRVIANTGIAKGFVKFMPAEAIAVVLSRQPISVSAEFSDARQCKPVSVSLLLPVLDDCDCGCDRNPALLFLRNVRQWHVFLC
jgi:hypothetical protein